MELKQGLKFPLSIQMFAEGGDDEGGNDDDKTPQPKTYSEEEFLKLKKSFDTTASELAQMKKANKEKLSEQEKLVQAQQEKDEALANAQKELLTIKLNKEFIVAGFDEKQSEELCNSFNEGKPIEFAKTLSTNIKTIIDNVRKEEQTKFQKMGNYPPIGSGNPQNGLNPIVEKFISSRNSSSNSARDLYLNKNKK